MADPSSRQLTYRPEIDGLRAIAVTAVVLSHAQLSFPGGFIGVDVFFVISGYLITSLIVGRIEKRAFSVRDFWARRCRRILPAAAVMLLVTLAAGWFLLLPIDFADLGKAVASQAALVANFYYWRTLGYFWLTADQVALLHTWSLAVEEQFYLCTPLLLLLVFRISKPTRRRESLLFVAGVGAVLSLSCSIWALPRYGQAAFYLLPSRAWELLFGTCLALFPSSWMSQRGATRELASWLGIVFILIPCFCYSRDTPFPGVAAVPPCLGAALFIWANSSGPTPMPLTAAGTLLAARVPVFVGLISYSLYLWHWPLLAFSNYWALAPLSIGYRVALVGLALGLGYVSWRCIETPFRHRRGSERVVLAVGGTVLACVFLGGFVVARAHGVPSRFSEKVLRYASAKTDSAFLRDMTSAEVLAGHLVPIGNRNPSAPVRVLIWGDSHAMAAMPAVDAFLLEKGIAGQAATHSSTPPVFEYSRKLIGADVQDAQRFNDAVFSYIRDHKIPDIVLAACWECYVGNSDISNKSRFERDLLITIRRLVDLGSRPWILLEPPPPFFDVPKALIRATVTGELVTGRPAKPDERAQGLNGIDNELFRAVVDLGGHVLDPRQRFLNSTGDHYIVAVGGVSLYRDSEHLTGTGAKLLLLPFFRDSVMAQTLVQ